MEILARPEQPENTQFSISVTDGGDRDAREVGATLESFIPNLRHRWRDRDAREVGAILEIPLLYLRFPLRYDDLAILDVVAVFLVFFHDSIV